MKNPRKVKPQSAVKRIKRNLNLVIFESAVTAGMLCMPIMTPFFRSLGLSQAEISLTQVIFTVIVSILNFPAGWLADRLSRKMANVVGDLGMFCALMLYSRIHGFWGAVCCETLLGVTMAFSKGVDVALLKHFCDQLARVTSSSICASSKKLPSQNKSEADTPPDPAQTIFYSKTVTKSFWQYVCTIGVLALGGPIGVIDFRLAVALSGVPSLIGAFASLFIQDDSVKLVPEYQNPFRDMLRIVKSVFRNPQLRTRVFAHACGREMTHAIIWVFTPLLIYAGVPTQIVALGWILNAIACIIGTKLARKLTNCCADWQKLALPVALMGTSMFILTIKINLFTVWFYLLMGVVQGWTNATLAALVQRHTPETEQTSVVSLTEVIGQILYIPTTLITGLAADIDLRLVPLATLVMFLPLGIGVSKQLYHEQ